MTDFFEFQSRTKIFSGRGALLHLASEIRLLGGSRAILISDETLKHLGMTDKIVAVLREDDLEVPVVYTDIPTDSSLKTANQKPRAFAQGFSFSYIVFTAASRPAGTGICPDRTRAVP